MRYDIIIRSGTIVDGLGGAPYQADVAILDGRIAKIGRIEANADEEIDATGMVVTPGFVDIHTHYDAQVTWANRLIPSSSHGVTTVVMGNCGVGFAPCRPEDHDKLIRLMEGVEDIPGVVMAEGLPWKWESFSEYLDFLEAREYDVDVGAYIPHAPLRVYAMGTRGLNREPANAADLERMSRLVSEAMKAGALGFSTSRSLNHRSSDQQLMPGISASESELIAIAKGVHQAGDGLLQYIIEFSDPETDFAMLRRIAEQSGVPMTFSLSQRPNTPDAWRTILHLAEGANKDGIPIKPQVYCRPIGLLLGLHLHYNFFSFSPSYIAIEELPLKEKLARMRDPETRARIISEFPAEVADSVISRSLTDLANIYLMAEDFDYAPQEADSLATLARERGLSLAELAYDMLIENEGRNVFYAPALNYAEKNLNAVAQMLRHPDSLFGLGDGGAHVGIICDASGPTFMLQHWAKDEGANGIPLPDIIKSLTSDNAKAMNLRDRGILAPNYRADINIISRDQLKLHRPEMQYDLPLGSGRLVQRAEGYVATIVAGEITYRNGEPTGRLPGRLVRGAQQMPDQINTQAV
ncbi:MAG: D-aminoacylase [Alphaproteobacteria bacterium]|nr:MAG: D-aminoacylase [Alphaproteobacteria bacterium]